MKLIADEGVDKAIIDAPRGAGFTVQYFAEEGAGRDDTALRGWRRAARH